jgi:hypothetical protein
VNLASRSRIKNRDWAAYSPSGHLDADIDQLDQPRYRLGHEHPEIRVGLFDHLGHLLAAPRDSM